MNIRKLLKKEAKLEEELNNIIFDIDNCHITHIRSKLEKLNKEIIRACYREISWRAK